VYAPRGKHPDDERTWCKEDRIRTAKPKAESAAIMVSRKQSDRLPWWPRELTPVMASHWRMAGRERSISWGSVGVKIAFTPVMSGVAHWLWATVREEIDREFMTSWERDQYDKWRAAEAQCGILRTPPVWIYRRYEVIRARSDVEPHSKALSRALSAVARGPAIFEGLAMGKDQRQVAAEMGLSEDTIARDLAKCLPGFDKYLKELFVTNQNVMAELAKVKRVMPAVFDALMAAAESGVLNDEEIAEQVAESLRVDTTWTPDPVPDVPEPKEDGPAKKEWGCAFIKRSAPVNHGPKYEANIRALNRLKDNVRPE
jgi:hypothetical protein